MIQLLLLVVSFFYGIVVGVIYNIILKKLLRIESTHVFFNTIFFISITMIYITIFYYLNNADIHLYLKLVLILGFILSMKVSNFSKKTINNHLIELFKKRR